MIRSLPFLGGTAKAEPQHDPWPPTWRLPSGAVQVEASYKKPARQKLVDRSTRAAAFLALMLVVLGHAQWPFPDLASLLLHVVGPKTAITVPELVTARLMVGAMAIGTMVGIYRLVLAILGLDRGTTRVLVDQDRITIDGQAFDRRVRHSFDLEPHPLARREDHRDRQQQISTPLYYRDSYVVTFQYGDRRIEIADTMGKTIAAKLVSRLQRLQQTSMTADSASPGDQRA